jgi:hypothetical protein
MSRSTTAPRLAAGAALLAATFAVSACGSASGAPTASGDDHEQEPGAAEAAAPTPRVALTYEGGILVLDAASLQVVADLDLDGFNRLNGAGDGRHLLVSTKGGFAALDMGTWSENHGDHPHHYTAEPQLHGVLVAAEHPGHVLVHDGLTALFDDATGGVTVVPADTWTAQVEAGEIDPARTYTTPAPHHGVAVARAGGDLLVTEGTEDERGGARLLDADDAVVAENAACPGVHGEAVAAAGVITLGCENGTLIVRDRRIVHVASPDAYGRLGNQSGSEESTVVLADYKVDGGAELERPTRVALIDTEAERLTLVDLPSSYAFRSLARGAAGEALVLGTDGSLHVIDPASARLLRSIPVVEPWEEPMEWQEPRPAVTVLEGMAYVTDPSANALHVVDVVTGEVWESTDLPVTPNEVLGVTG